MNLSIKAEEVNVNAKEEVFKTTEVVVIIVVVVVVVFVVVVESTLMRPSIVETIFLLTD